MAVQKVTKNNFEEIKNSGKTVLLDFYADWCGPCHMVSPFVEEIAQEYPQYVVGKINVDEEPELVQMFGVSGIPTLIVLKDGQITQRAVGSRSKEKIIALLRD